MNKKSLPNIKWKQETETIQNKQLKELSETVNEMAKAILGDQE